MVRIYGIESGFEQPLYKGPVQMMFDDLAHELPHQTDDRTRSLALALTDRVGWTLIHRLLEKFGTLEGIFAASETDLRTVRGIGPQIAANIAGLQLGQIAATLRQWDTKQITTATWLDAAYPQRLRDLPDMPLVLFWKGTLPEILPAARPAIAIVGTREPSPASMALARHWAADFAACGWIAVSGMARGIDSAAHEGALSAGGETIAVLGCGVNIVYPPEHSQLARHIATQGALVSEAQPDAKPSTTALMRRNRLITALSHAVIVIEAPADSGALHAARSAHAQGKLVFAIDNSVENRKLLKEFAQPPPAQLEDLIAQVPTAGCF